MIDPVQKLAALRAMAEAATDEVLADFLLSPGSGTPLDFVIIGSNPTTIGIDFAADPAIYDLPDGDGLRLLDAATVWTANAGIGAPILTHEELVAEMCRLCGPPPTVIEATSPPEIKEIRPPPFDPPHKPWLTRNRRNFKRSQKRR